MPTISERINILRQLMAHSGTNAYIIPSADPHMSEDIAGHWKKREWISGFDGSDGTVVILQDQAGLWTDSRYYIQAENQLQGSGITLFRAGMPHVPDYISWIISNLREGDTVGLDGELFSVADIERMKQLFSPAGLELKTDIVLINEKWANLPPPPLNKIFLYEERFAGASVTEKFKAVGEKLEAEGADILLLTALDEITWMFNIRGNDIKYNPVAIAYALVAKDSGCIFIEPEKLTPQVISYFDTYNIRVLPYNNIFSVLSKLPKGCRIWIDKQKTNYTAYDSISSRALMVEKESPVSPLKAIKNKVEIEGTKKAVIKDGIALTKAFYWLEMQLKSGKRITEKSFAEKLKEYKEKQPDFFEESFHAITAYGSNGAIVHYHVTPESDQELLPGNLFLVDSGTHFLDGTTDITRTIVIGNNATPQQKRDYTNVLKGHIALASVRFPEGTHGVQLDVLARQFLWNESLSYGHGTGHGIGHFLNTHEGPQSIRPTDDGVALKPGMLISNEPGLYRKGEYGIRLENMILVTESGDRGFGPFFQFETLSLFPFEHELIDPELMSEKEINWLVSYHQEVYNKLNPFLPAPEKEWLKFKTNLTSIFPGF